jgi:hypothetical protein
MVYRRGEEDLLVDQKESSTLVADFSGYTKLVKLGLTN